MYKKMVVIGFIISLSLVGCQKFEYIGDKDGQKVFLDSNNGKLIYINNSNRVSDYVDLKLNSNEIAKIKSDKEINDSLQKMQDWGRNDISGTKYSIDFQTRFYSDKLLYILQISPYDDNLSRLASTVSVYLTDVSGFTLEIIEPQRWSRTVDDDGKPIKMSARGSIPITLENYLEIDDWNPSWRN